MGLFDGFFGGGSGGNSSSNTTSTDKRMVVDGSGTIGNGAVVWGVVRTELKYLRRDVDHAHQRMDEMYKLIDRRLQHGG